MKASWKKYGFTLGQQARQERNKITKQPSNATKNTNGTATRTPPQSTEPHNKTTDRTIERTNKRHRLTSNEDIAKRAKRRNNIIPGQHNETVGKEQAQSQEPKAHRQKRKRQNIATTNKDEENEPNTRIPKRNNNKTYDGVTDGPMNKKSNNKRR